MQFWEDLGATAFIYDDDTNRIIYDDYYGTFDAETSTFTVSEGLIYNPNYEKTCSPNYFYYI